MRLGDKLLCKTTWGKTVIKVQFHVWTKRKGWISQNICEIPTFRLRELPEVLIDDIREWLGYKPMDNAILNTVDSTWEEGAYLDRVVRIYPDTKRTTRIFSANL